MSGDDVSATGGKSHGASLAHRPDRRRPHRSRAEGNVFEFISVDVGIPFQVRDKKGEPS